MAPAQYMWDVIMYDDDTLFLLSRSISRLFASLRLVATVPVVSKEYLFDSLKICHGKAIAVVVLILMCPRCSENPTSASISAGTPTTGHRPLQGYSMTIIRAKEVI